ncbi:BglG family transcription antiterminator [Neobacillus citreus]|uniref:BglG family transcription antiterminator n=1 Tax=Neobacillus citreus TaxID=2833578 RepID=A0A942T9M9_9BACI|nr:PRD domain-containing protein [Neobacillus citreus]MCH6269459.1 BglG family transcription antiterminator [Neobacillus citreus]
MKKQIPVLDSRQKDLLRTLLQSNKAVSIKEISEMFKLSTRTIQREIKYLKSILKVYELKIEKKIGEGFQLSGPSDGKKQLKEHIQQAKDLIAYTPDERQDGITYDLLLSKEPIKQYVFSKKYGVTETTISSDMDKVSMWLEKGGIKLIRTPGIGTYIDGQEKQRRTMLSQLLHKDITFEEWLELFHRSNETEEEIVQYKLSMTIRNRLLRFVEPDEILDVERVVNQVLNEQNNIELTDRNYVNLIVHLMLAVERIKKGDVIDTPFFQDYEFDNVIYTLANRIVDRLEKALEISIPKIETNYIVLHLAGARLSTGDKIDNYNSEEFTLIELTQSFIRAMEYYLEESFDGDELLLEGLVSHFAPALTRLKHGLQIHNPMLEKIKEKNPEIFAACKKACKLLTNKTGYLIPNGEIGYLALHIGAAILRKNDSLKNDYKAIVVCSSGLGTSTYLASRLRTKMSNIEVEAIVSMKQLDGFLQKKPEVDIIISTINLPFIKNKNVVIVSPFLNKKDQLKIQHTLLKVNKSHPHQNKVNEMEKKSPSFLSLAKYGEGMIQILRNLKIYNDVIVRPPSISSILNLIKNTEEINDHIELSNDLEKREQQGTFVIGNLAMVHAKSVGVNNLVVVVFRLTEPVLWPTEDEEQQLINTVLLLAVPQDAPKEHIEMISEISSMLIEEEFVSVLTESIFEDVKSYLEDILLKAYEMKAKRSIKETPGK